MTATAPEQRIRPALDIHEAAELAIEEHAADFQAMLVDFKMPAELAATITPQWDGQTFVAPALTTEAQRLEYGDGRTPPLAAVRKALTRILPVLQETMSEALGEDIDDLVEGAEY